MLIDCSYFTKGSRHIINASMGTMPNANATEVNRAIEAFIAEYQERYLRNMLGHSVGSRINAYLVSKDEDEKFQLIENFEELVSHLRESFAYFVFFQILRDTNSQASINGAVRLKTANTVVAPIKKQVNAWNAMVEENEQFAKWVATSPINGIRIDECMLTYINSFNL